MTSLNASAESASPRPRIPPASGGDGARPAAGPLLFLFFFALYLFTAPPSLAPWRDSGEMASSAFTLGVSHPTSYPLYVLAARAADALPLGRPAYRDSLLSAAAAAFALAALFAFMRRRFGAWAGGACALLLGLNGTFWTVALVQEMYSAWTLCAVLALWAALELRDRRSLRRWLLFCFACGLALTNRLDLLLWAPGLLWLTLSDEQTRGQAQWAGLALLVFPAVMALLGANWPMAALVAATAVWAAPRSGRSRWLASGALAGLAGLSLYAYLPLRSLGGPWLDWNHPADFSNFLDSLLRTRYGGTLDLLSKNYRTGECFGDNMALYGRHLWRNFSPVGLAAVVWGFWRAARKDAGRALGLAAAWAWSGPIFLLMANLPPNPHAAAIVEPHYLLSELILVVLAGEGVADLGVFGSAIPALACAILLAWPLWLGRPARRSMRERFFDYDYARNVLKDAPSGAVVVAKKDVQLYTLWYFQTVQGLRPDLRIVSQGLAGSAWYQKAWQRLANPPALVALRDADGWKRFAQANAPVYATFDAELPGSVSARAKPHGLLLSLSPDEPRAASPSLELSVLRGEYDYEAQPDFFDSDLIDTYGQAWTRLGSQSLRAGQADAARGQLLRGWSYHWIFPDPASLLGFLSFTSGDYAGARRYYALEAAVSRRLLGMAQDYRSLPDLKQSLAREAAQALTHEGAACEKTGDRDSARQAYRQALSIFPLAETHYNLAVLDWGADKARAASELEAALAVDPHYEQAARYLALLRRR